MNTRSVGSTLLFVLSIPFESPAATCESLQTLLLPNTTIRLAQSVAAGSFSLPGGQPSAQLTAAFKQLPAFCRVAATLRPVRDSDIKIEVWMPLSNWNGKFQGVGNGGFAGAISYLNPAGNMDGGLAGAITRGYATASTDTGHTADTGSDFLKRPVALEDFGHRAVHEMTVAAKAIVAAFYGSGPKRSYWNGCSTGGRQGLTEAQRYPTDYDGIAAGAPANPQSRFHAWNLSVSQAVVTNPAHTIPPSKFPMIHNAVLTACDALDGLKDHLIEDPSRCRFDFKTLGCKGEDSSSCLTAAQIETAQKMTSPAVDGKSGDTIFPGLALGAELGWRTPEPFPRSIEYYKHVVFKNPDWDWRTFKLENAVELAERNGNNGWLTATADLAAFRQRGGKLILYHGWSDPLITAQSGIDYYRAVVNKVGAVQSAEWVRLFMAPGMGHCAEGDGPNTFDVMTALEQWVEHAKAPAAMTASLRRDGKVVRTRPLCPYPQVARYRGTGSIDDAANFACATP